MTSPQDTARFEKQSAKLTFANLAGISQTIEIDEGKSFQTIDGFGFCLTGGSASINEDES